MIDSPRLLSVSSRQKWRIALLLTLVLGLASLMFMPSAECSQNAVCGLGDNVAACTDTGVGVKSQKQEDVDIGGEPLRQERTSSFASKENTVAQESGASLRQQLEEVNESKSQDISKSATPGGGRDILQDNIDRHPVVEARLVQWLTYVASRLARLAGYDIYVLHQAINDFVKHSEVADILFELTNVARSLALAAVSFTKLSLLVSRPILALLALLTRACFPHLRTAVVAGGEFVLQQDPKLLVGLAAALSAMEWVRRQGYIARLRRRYIEQKRKIQRRYLLFIEDLQRKSKVAASILPHAMFLLPVGAILYFFPQLFSAITTDSLFVYVPGLYYPVFRSIFAIIELQRLSSKVINSAVGDTDATRDEVESVGSQEIDDVLLMDGTEEVLDSPAKTSKRRRKGGKDKQIHHEKPDSMSRNTSKAAAEGEKPKDMSHAATHRQQQRLSRAITINLHYWVVLSWLCALWLIIDLGLTFVPSRFIPQFSNTAGAWWMFFFLWLQLPWINGASALFVMLVPLINRYVKQVELPKVDQHQSSLILNLLVTIGLISKERRALLGELLTHGGYMLFGAVFFFTPGFLTVLGTILIGYCLPAYSATKLLVVASEHGISFPVQLEMKVKEKETTQEDSSTKQSSPSGSSFSAFGLFRRKAPQTSTAVSATTTRSPAGSAPMNLSVPITILEWWLKLFVVLFVFEYFHQRIGVVLGWLPLWHHAKLALLMWMQLPYFNGAQRIFKMTVEKTITLKLLARRRMGDAKSG